MKKISILPILSMVLGIAISQFACSQVNDKAVKEFSGIPSDLKINQIQVLGTHNSYSLSVDTALLNYLAPMVTAMMSQFEDMITPEQMESFKENHPNGFNMAEALNYEHPSFDEQLDAGIRSLEIDVFYDPTGNRFHDPAGYRHLRRLGKENLAPFNSEGLEEPGFKVLHMADLDFRSHYPTFKQALEAVAAWSDENTDHVPIFIMVEAKDSNIPLFPDPTEVLPFDEKVFDQLDQEIIDILGRNRIITPDDVRGEYPTLRDAVMAHNWPAVEASRGKFMFLLLPAAGGGQGNESAYITSRPNLEGRTMFVQSQPEDDFGAFLLLDNAIIRHDEIQEYVKQGYFVRTRSDIDTYEAKVNDYTRAKAAFSSGAQIVSTDFFQPGNFYGTEFVVKLPGKDVARKNPINGNP